MKTILFLAQTDLASGLGRLLGVFQGVSLVVLVASLVWAGVNVSTGRTESAWHGVLGAGLGALSWVIVKTLFDTIGGQGVNITPQPF